LFWRFSSTIIFFGRSSKDNIGIILCAGKKTERVELLELDKSGIHVAEYLTAFPSKENPTREVA